MLKACAYCGRIHPKGYQCKHKPQRTKQITHIDRFRWSTVWKKKREEIRQRDLYLCRLCAEGKNQERLCKYNSDVEVHHIAPLIEDYDRRLDNDNLICLCSYHHELAEKGEINKKILFHLAKHPPLPLKNN